MAGTTISAHQTAVRESDVKAGLVAINKLVDDVETLRAALNATCAKLDLDAGVTDTNYAALAAVTTAATMTAPKVAINGTVVTDV